MIKLEHVVLPSPKQMEFVIEGMRNPLNSWDNSDSYITYVEDAETNAEAPFEHFIGDKDLDLMNRLSSAGVSHRKFMRMMPVYVRITAPLYWWKEFDTYKTGTVANSCSTMHKITAKEFHISDFSFESLHPESFAYRNLLDNIKTLNTLRDFCINWDSIDKNTKNANHFHSKEYVWKQIIQSLPSSYNQTRNVMLNYEVLAKMYFERKSHKLSEWREFCAWIETLPYEFLMTYFPIAG